jgi:hypothetical protein
LLYGLKSNRSHSHSFGRIHIYLPVIHKYCLSWSHADSPKAFMKDALIRLDQPEFARQYLMVEMTEPLEMLSCVDSHVELHVRQKRGREPSAI